jgi:hypothetical protein
MHDLMETRHLSCQVLRTSVSMASQDLCSLSSQQHIQTSNQQHSFSFFPIIFIYFALGQAQELNGLTLTQPVVIGHDKPTRIWLESEPPNTNCLQHLDSSIELSNAQKSHKCQFSSQ